jgi:hypothetical protein
MRNYAQPARFGGDHGVTFLRHGPELGRGELPGVWVDTDAAQGPELVLQGRFADEATWAACSQDSPPADDEGIVRIPLSMVE